MQADGIGEWSACYVCHKCGEEFACAEQFGEEKEARGTSDLRFDRQQRRFCYRCGYQLSDTVVPESAYIAALNQRIDELEEARRRLVEKVKLLQSKAPPPAKSMPKETIGSESENEQLTEHDDALIAMYHCDNSRFAAFCSDEDCYRVDHLIETLSDDQISEAIERYNKGTFGVTRKECESGQCLFCNDRDCCEKYGAKKDYDQEDDEP